MATPPKPASTQGPICKVCGKQMKEHSFQQQINCNNEAKKQGISLI